MHLSRKLSSRKLLRELSTALPSYAILQAMGARAGASGRAGMDWDKLKTFHFAAETGSLTAK